jgi:hypothetical protein
MATPTTTDQATGWYVYGIVPAGVKAPRRKRTVGDGPQATLVRWGTIAALTSPVPIGAPIGTPDDLIAHQEMLDAVAARAAVLPMRFGAVLPTNDAVERGLLEPHHDEFAAALDKVAATVQFVVAGRYAQARVLTEVLDENAEAAELTATIRGKDELATRDLRIRLGEIINGAIAAKREADTAAFAAAVEPYCEAIAGREPTHEEDAVGLALLVRRDQEDDLRQEVREAAARWRDRVDFRLLGPMAPYDFVVAAKAA